MIQFATAFASRLATAVRAASSKNAAVSRSAAEDRRVIGGKPVIPHETGLLLVGQFRQDRAFKLVDEGVVELQRQQVGIGEIAIVVRFLLGAHRARLALGADRRAASPVRSTPPSSMTPI